MGVLAALVAITAPGLIRAIHFGLEFRGGYEIYYAAAPKPGAAAVTPETLLATADVLRRRCDGIGMAEPEIHLEGVNHIRLKIAGLTSADQARSLLGDPTGLPTILTEQYSQTVGSVLGTTALKETLTGGAIGVGLIVLLLLILYRGMGLVIAGSLLVYLWLLVAAFNAMHATFSLSAVVAFVLGIGMAADASIICCERVREELRRRQGMGTAIRTGFRASLATITDANIVTALAMLALFVAGIGPIQGFALTMLVSIAISFLTNIVLVRFLGEALAESRLIPPAVLFRISSPARQGQENGQARSFGFVRLGRLVMLVPIGVIIVGGWYYSNHGLNLDIDFTAGTALDIDIPRSIDQDTATRVMTDAGIVPATVSIGGADNHHIAARFDQILKPAELQQIMTAFQAAYGQGVAYEENTADPGVARAFAEHAVYALLAACAGIVLYIGVRFAWSIGLATLLSIIHDLLLVTALFSLFKLEIDVTYIAALLTIMGYSLNDKIVIFSRIRQNSRELSADEDGGVTERLRLESLADRSILQTLGRSIYTVLTVVLASASLLAFGCEPLQMFSLALVLGLTIGAYSSIFLACPLWIWFRTSGASGERRSTGAQALQAAGLMIVLAAAGLGAWRYVTRSAPGASAVKVALASLGDLTPFQRIAEDSLRLVEAHDLPGAKTRIKDLETAWDAAEEHLQPLNPEEWTSVDKSIDRALTQLRSGQPDAAACAVALKTLIAKFAAVPSPAPAVAAPAAQQAAPPGPAAAPLGDLAPYRAIAEDTLHLVDAKDLPGATARIKDLETAWDEAESRLRPMSPADWRTLDKAIDRALSKLRSKKPDAAACETALKDLMSACDSLDRK